MELNILNNEAFERASNNYGRNCIRSLIIMLLGECHGFAMQQNHLK